MNNTSIAVAAIIVVLVVAAAGLALHPESPLTIVYLFPSDIYHWWIRFFYSNGRPYPRPQPQPRPHPTGYIPGLAPKFPVNPNPPNGYDPSLQPKFPVNPNPPNGYDPSLAPKFPVRPPEPAPFDPTPNASGYKPHMPAQHGFPVNPNGNITPYTPNPRPKPIPTPNIQPIEPHHNDELFPFSA